MADPKGFLKYTRELPATRPVEERIQDYQELYEPFAPEKTVEQASRCMDCGVPFCHSGCPLGNIIPAFNDAVYRQDWQEAYDILSSTNNFPEFTGRICPAPCESACVLGINQPPVAIEHIEKSIVEAAFEHGYARPAPPAERSGKLVAVVGSGPAGLAAAAQLNKAGHKVTVFERADRVGGLLRYGIPDFKLEKRIIDRRLALLEAEGIIFRTKANVGVNIDAAEMLNRYDAIVLAGGSTVPRQVDAPGRNLKGIHFAMDFLEQNNRRVAGDTLPPDELPILATGKNVVVIGGGDTGADCVGTSHRQGAASVLQLEIMPKPPGTRDPWSWPNWPMVLRTSTSHEEGGTRDWSVMTKAFLGDDQGQLRAIQLVRLEWALDAATGRHSFREIAGSEMEVPCELAFIAAGFMHPQHEGMLAQLGVALDERGNVQAHNYQTSQPKVFAAGDMRRGQSLVVWAISEGREAARAVDTFLQRSGLSWLEAKDSSALLMA